MSDQNAPHPREPLTPAPAGQANGTGQSGPDASGQSGDAQIDEEMNSTRPTSSLAQPSAPELQMDGSAHRIPHWLQQAERFLRVIVRMYLGLLVMCAPWYPAAWDNNPLFSTSPGVQAFVTHGAVRGLVSGLGLLNLWIAVRDALRSSSKRDLP